MRRLLTNFIVLIFVFTTYGCYIVNSSTVKTMPDFQLCDFLGPHWITTQGERLAIMEELDRRGLACINGTLVKKSNAGNVKESEGSTPSLGTGFYITSSGYMITNHHVVDSCKSIQVKSLHGPLDAVLIARDIANDLALIKVKVINDVESAHFRGGKGIRAGDEIITVGYPFGEYLGDNIKVTTGTVSSLSGIGNDTSMMQITAPIQPGNSGGPLLDSSGNVVGVVSSKLNEIAIAKLTGSLPQNVNFAIKSSTVLTFLDVAGMDYQSFESVHDMERADIVDDAKEYTTLVQCNR